MKSVSPSAFIIGPMTGIMLEAVLLELMIWLFGNNMFGLEMVIRAIFVVTAFTAISVELHNEKVRSFLYRIGFGQFYQAVGMAFGALPVMISLLPNSKEIIRHPLQSLLKPLVMSDQWVVFFRES
jgi:hypothetical protein